jgi:transcriptional regulator with XRE-family HTH domain
MQESETTGARIRQARAMAGLSQPELSVKSGVPQTTISSMENGTAAASFAALRALCDALDCSADWMVGRAPSPRPLEPQSWVVDLDVVDRLRKAESGDAAGLSDSERRWAFCNSFTPRHHAEHGVRTPARGVGPSLAHTTEEETMISAELEKLTAGHAQRAKRAAAVAFLCIFGAWCAIAAFDSRGTHAMTIDEALSAMRTPLTEGERKVAVAALRRQSCLAVAALVAEAERDTPSGREAAAALGHLRKELSR